MDDTDYLTNLSNATSAPGPTLTVASLLEAQRRLESEMPPPAYVEDVLIPLRREDADGVWRDVLCVRIGKTMHVHPERMPKFLELLAMAEEQAKK